MLATTPAMLRVPSRLPGEGCVTSTPTTIVFKLKRIPVLLDGICWLTPPHFRFHSRARLARYRAIASRRRSRQCLVHNFCPRDIWYLRTEISHFIVWPISEEPQFEIHSVDSLLVAHVLVPYLHNLKLFR